MLQEAIAVRWDRYALEVWPPAYTFAYTLNRLYLEYAYTLKRSNIQPDAYQDATEDATEDELPCGFAHYIFMLFFLLLCQCCHAMLCV